MPKWTPRCFPWRWQEGSLWVGRSLRRGCHSFQSMIQASFFEMAKTPRGIFSLQKSILYKEIVHFYCSYMGTEAMTWGHRGNDMGAPRHWHGGTEAMTWGHGGNDMGAWRQSPSLPPWSIRPDILFLYDLRYRSPFLTWEWEWKFLKNGSQVWGGVPNR